MRQVGLFFTIAAVLPLLFQIFGGWISDSIGRSFVAPSFRAYIAEQSSENNRGKIYGIADSIFAVVGVLGSPLGGFLSDRKGERHAIVPGMGIFSASMMVFITSRNLASMSIAYIMFGMGQALMSPAYSSLISKAVPEKLRGLAFGLFSTSVGVVALPAPFIGAWLYERFNPQVPFILPTIALLVAMPIAWRKFRMPKQIEEIPVAIPAPTD